MLRNDLIIVSNNSLVQSLPEVEVSLLAGNAREVLGKAFSMVAEGHSLLSHPLAGSVKPNQNPFKSILMSKQKNSVDQQSLALLNTCLGKTEDMLQDRPLLSLKDEIENDYQLLDFDLLLNAMNSLSKGR